MAQGSSAQSFARRVAIVPASRAEALRAALRGRGLLDRTVKIARRGGDIVMPLSDLPPFALEPFGARLGTAAGLEPRPSPVDPAARIRERLAAMGVPDDALPTKWRRIGDVVVVRLPPAGRPWSSHVAGAFGEVLGARTVVEDVSGIHGRFRTPAVRVLWGAGTETVHLEDGVRFRLDVARLMFSSGNVAERIATTSRVRPGDVVVDLFAGIGYFALPIAIKASPSRVHACEENPIAYRYLLENIRLNRVSNVVPRLGDCRAVAPSALADVVLLGHFDAIAYVDVACRSLRPEGGVLVVHGVGPREAFPGRFVEQVRGAVAGSGRVVRGARARIVKSYAPRIVHGVVEASVGPGPKGISRPAGSAGR